jgi:hypothetical protein
MLQDQPQGLFGKEHPMIKCLAGLFLTLLLPSLAVAAGYPLVPTKAYFDLPSERWQVSSEPPEAAIQAMMDDSLIDARQKGKEVDRAKLRAKALRYVSMNELFVVNPATSAFLMIDLSPLKDGEKAPDQKLITASLEAALEELKGQTNQPDQLKHEIHPVKIPGLQYGMRLDADFQSFADPEDLTKTRPHHFTGIIGYCAPYWVFFYYNDKKLDPRDQVEMDQLLASLAMLR